jgi:hypothetical protein
VRKTVPRPVVAAAAAAAAAVLTTSTLRAAPPDDQWRFEIAPYVWATSLDGTVGAAGRTTPVNADFAQVVHDSDSLLALMLHGEAARGPLALFTDVTFGKIGVDEAPTPNGTIDVTSTILFLEAGAAYRLLDDHPLGGHPDSPARLSVDALAGARLTTLGVDLHFRELGADIDRTNAWVDPFVGARATLDLGPRWSLRLRGDVGGFGAGSQFTWQALGLVGYRFHIGSVPTTLFAGYRALGQDFVAHGFTWDTVTHGPMLGLSFTF